MISTFNNCNIGCNIVDPECDSGELYTEDVYRKNIELYRAYGIRHIEFSHVVSLDEAAGERLREFCRNLGIIPWSIHSEHLNAPGRSELDAYLKVQTRCCKVAHALDAKVIVCHLPNLVPRAGNIKRDTDILKRLADITGSFGQKLAVETPPHDYIIEVVDAVNRDDVGMNLDTGHTALDNCSPARAARLIGKRLFTTHLQDNFGVNDDHQTPGMGLIDWDELLTAFQDIGYSGPLLMELTTESVKARRSVRELRDFELEKEILYGKAYLEFVWRKIYAQRNFRKTADSTFHAFREKTHAAGKEPAAVS